MRCGRLVLFLEWKAEGGKSEQSAAYVSPGNTPISAREISLGAILESI
jgi:hypothetical protein